MSDPQLPCLNPTVSFWQIPPDPTISEVRSMELPSNADYVIIGSGVTGCSVAKTLLECSTESSSVAVLEARTLTSGATGRNGGLLSNFVPYDYKALSDRFGHEQAVKIARLAIRTLEQMHSLANETAELKRVSEVRRLVDVTAFETDQDLRNARESFQLYKTFVPEDKGTVEILSPNEAASKYKLITKAGAIAFPNGALWPYRLVTALWAQLIERWSARLLVETNSPVTEITFDPSMSPYPYSVHTPRGIIRTSHIIHATNGYAGHLLPALRGKIYPLRGHMSTQRAPASFGRPGREICWSILNSRKYDERTGIYEPGMYYSNQNPHSGDIFIGGERVPLDEMILSDDTYAVTSCAENLADILLPKHFLEFCEDGQNPEVRNIWSGIMGFTADTVPLIGRLPHVVTNRGECEWVAAGFNGYGMALCWSCGEAVAKLVLGEHVDFLPEVFVVTEERLNNNMDTVQALRDLVSH